ncbi:TetR/AcrR family transcriptional regulator [Nocardia sp. A7]|uniref:TetR/AcrR family transcriptional regulator n=1 Tax=Nocardia sp. A7 TaxID=2789274 RepID=UPI00397B15BD
MVPNSDQDGQSRSFIEEARRAQIVTAAVETIAEVGYSRASMSRIAARAGISRGLISYHFAGKAELIGQVMATVYADGAAFIAPMIDAETTPTAQLRAYIRSNLEYMRAHPARMVALVEIVTGGGLADLPGIDPTESDRQMLLPLVELFTAGQAAGEFREFDVTVMARIVRGVIDAVPTALSHDPDLDIDRYLREITTAVDLATRPI